MIVAEKPSPISGVPVSYEAEASVVGSMIQRPKVIGEVVGSHLQVEHFYFNASKMLFNAVVDAYYADEPTDALSIVRAAGMPLLKAWGDIDEHEALRRVRKLTDEAVPGDAVPHSKVVQEDSQRRRLLEIAEQIQRSTRDRERTPEEIASQATTDAAKVATNGMLTDELIQFGDLGRRLVERQRGLMEANAAGIEIGVRFGMQFLDERLHGLKGSEVMILAGPPGGGKSALAWVMATRFAERQVSKPAEQRMGTLVVSAEMAEAPSSDRIAQNLAGVPGANLRDGTTSEDELARIIKEWGKRRDIPLYYNFTSMMRASQMRALIATAVQRYNVGLVVIDHMRYFDPDVRLKGPAEEDEEKARFVRERIAKDMDIAIVLLAHTTKAADADDGRPKLSHLRGGGMVAAHADFVAFTYQPARYADPLDEVDPTEMQLLWEKNRHGEREPTDFYFNPERMVIRDPV